MRTTASVGDKVVCQLLPGKALFQLENCQLDEVTHQITLIASSTKTTAHCPLCQQLTHRVHSGYERKLTDIPWADYNINLQLRVQKFFCINALCKRRIFTERLDGVTAPWARKTKRLTEKLTAIALALGGNAGVHLSQNLGFVVSPVIAEANACPVVPRFPQNTSLKRKVQSELAQHRRRTIHEQVWSLRSQGLSGQAIAAELGVSKTTVFNYLRSSTFIERRERSDQGLSLLNPYQDYLLSRWNSGNYNTQELFEEIRQAGYTGSYATVVRFTRYLKTLPGFELGKGSIKDASPRVSSSSHRPLTPSRVTALVLRRPELTEPDDHEAIARLQTAHSDLKSAIELAQQFASLVRQRLPEQLDAWLDKAKNRSVSLLRRFAVGLESDYDAVKAGVTLSTSNGPVEGHINRLKMLKRQMYGRAKIDLLERRFLLAI